MGGMPDEKATRGAMRAIEVDGAGGPDRLRVSECPCPEPGAGGVLIRVHAAGINRPDLMQRAGLYPPPADASPLLGLEVAGEVVAVGPGVRRWRPGDMVCALVNGGGYAEFCVAPEGQCLPIPSGLDAIGAAALPETSFTVWANLFAPLTRAGAALRAGETVLVHGGSSGIGVTAIQFAVARGARVIVTAGSREKCDACLRIGATAALNYRETDFVEGVQDVTDGGGVDVVLDMVGGPYLERNIRVLARDGRLSIIAVSGGKIAERIDLLPIMQKRLRVMGSTMRPRTPAEKAEIAADLEREIWPLIEAGQVRPVIEATFPFERAADAHTLLEAGSHVGKIVLTFP
jgi:putative PIG3 family NAD(P)H quinone oxidoreductase